MANRNKSYLMENIDEAIRLEVKTDPEAVKKQALWCGLKPGLRVLDAGCGAGKVTSLLHDMIMPGGHILGVDSSKERILLARKQYGRSSGIQFMTHDLRDPLEGVEPFDVIWVRFFLEYNREEGPEIIKALSSCLKPGGYLCLMDLDRNCLNHYEMPPEMEDVLNKIMKKLEKDFNFDPYAGKKLYAYLFDYGFQNIEVDLMAHHLIYGEVQEKDAFNWLKKEEVISKKIKTLFKNYPGGHSGFYKDFIDYLYNPRRFIYTPMILCKGMKPLSS